MEFEVPEIQFCPGKHLKKKQENRPKKK